LARLAGGIGDRQVRQWAPSAGRSRQRPAACYPAAVLGLGATITTNKRKIGADDFFKGLFGDRARDRRADHRRNVPAASARATIKFKNRPRALRWSAYSSPRLHRACELR